jgi:serine/threonine-protein kinase
VPGVPGESRLEAASLAGRATGFTVVLPWTRPVAIATGPATPAAGTGAFSVALLIVGIGGAALFARRNIRLGRGDRRGAARLAWFSFSASMAAWLIGEDHAASFQEVYLMATAIGASLAIAGWLWLLYLAVEPYVRRTWPRVLASWTRLLTGGFRDPVVGRDILIGCAVAGLSAVDRMAPLVPGWFGRGPEQPIANLTSYTIIELPKLLAHVLAIASTASIGLILLFLMFLVRLTLRREWIAVVVVTLVLMSGPLLSSANPIYLLPFTLVVSLLRVLTLVRVGLLAMVVALFADQVLLAGPSVLPLGSWHSGLGAVPILIVTGLALFAFTSALAGRGALGTIGDDA